LPDYYEQNSAAFVSNTRDVDMSDLRFRFLASLPDTGTRPARILDAGSGSGRDALAFSRLGYSVEAFDASAKMVAVTRDYAGVPTRQMRFEEFVWDHPFEGIWACASLLHVANVDLPSVLDRLVAHLSLGGVLYLSFKYGEGERLKDSRRFTDMTPDRLAFLLDRCAGLGQPEIWLSRDSRPDRASEDWVNAVVKKA
jgi:SAM-dependent methyltransferase